MNRTTFSFWIRRPFRFVGLPAVAALAVFLVSISGVLPASLVESIYSRRIFPLISRAAGIIADAVPFTWLDPLAVALVLFVAIALRRRKWRWLLNAAACAYLAFFFGWGLNYHRMRIEPKLALDSRTISAHEIETLTNTTAHELNRLGKEAHGELDGMDTAAVAALASQHVRRFLTTVDGLDWESARRVKQSILLEPWFRSSAVDGMFNPFGHEPLAVGRLLDVERPFVYAHELAHVRGYPDEGDANLIAFLAAVTSPEPSFQYSGWLTLWMYLPVSKPPLDSGPKQDLKRIAQRFQADTVPAISRAQTAALNTFLHANGVKEGIVSYNRFVIDAAAAQQKGILPIR